MPTLIVKTFALFFYSVCFSAFMVLEPNCCQILSCHPSFMGNKNNPQVFKIIDRSIYFLWCLPFKFGTYEKKKTFLLALCPKGNDYPGWFRLSQTFDWAQLGVEPVEAWKPAVVWNCCPTAHCYISSDVIAYSYQQYQWDLHSPLHEIKQYNTDRSFVKCALCYQKNCKKRPKINYEKNKALLASIATKKYKNK